MLMDSHFDTQSTSNQGNSFLFFIIFLSFADTCDINISSGVITTEHGAIFQKKKV